MKADKVEKIITVLNESRKQIQSQNFLSEVYGDFESDEEGDHMDDLGDELDFDDAFGDEDEEMSSDPVDIELNKVMDLLVAADYPEETAEDAVFDAVSSLVNEGSIEDTPGPEAGDDEKSSWIFNSIPKIKARLMDMGLEFDETI